MYIYLHMCIYIITMLVLIKCNQNAMGNNYMPLIIL